MSFIRTTLNTLTAEAKDNIYNLSVVVLASAQLKDKNTYDANLKKLQDELSKKPDDSFKAWMYGRIAVAANTIDDKDALAKTLPKLEEILNNVQNDNKAAWARGYLAAVKYTDATEQAMLKAADELKAIPDALWAHVMNLQAAAIAGKREVFDLIIDKMKTLTKKNTLVEALSEIPRDDWQAWAVGIAFKAAETVKDKDLSKELSETLARSIEEAKNKDMKANAMLAEMNKSTLVLQNAVSSSSMFSGSVAIVVENEKKVEGASSFIKAR